MGSEGEGEFGVSCGGIASSFVGTVLSSDDADTAPSGAAADSSSSSSIISMKVFRNGILKTKMSSYHLRISRGVP